MKSGDQIEFEFYEFIEASPLRSFINGQMYRDDMRPHNSMNEDLVVTFKTGDASQFQTGEVAVNVYVPFIENGGALVRDITRCRFICNEMIKVFKEFTNSEYLIEMITTPKSISIPGVRQTMVNARLEFTRVEN